jgi:hypothetical protein
MALVIKTLQLYVKKIKGREERWVQYQLDCGHGQWSRSLERIPGSAMSCLACYEIQLKIKETPNAE